MIISLILERQNNKVTFFQKSPAILIKNEDKPNSRHLSRVFSTKTSSLWKNCGFFGLFSGDKGDNIDYVDDQDYDQSQ